MYPRLSDIFQDLFGVNLPLPIYSFGAMLAVAFLAAAWLTRKQLDRMYAVGRVSSVRVPVAGEKGKRQKMEAASPSVLIGTITIIAAVAGIAGSKLFHILENLDQFARDPLGMIFNAGGLTFFGGLICAGAAIFWYVRKKGQPIGAFADAIAPGLMLAYGIGRIGCYLAGDGDWGVCSSLANKPGWLPAWLWSEDFSRNILNIDLSAQCGPGFDGVFPTMLYEFAAAALLAGILWTLRKHPYKNGWLFSLYLVFAGVERFLIEKIRVNNEFDLFGLTVTQAEVIAVMVTLTGLIGLALLSKKFTTTKPPIEEASVAA